MRIKPLSLNNFTLILSLYFLLVLNIPLLKKLVTVLQHTEQLKLGLIISFPLFFSALFYLVFSLFTVRYLAKPIAVVLILLSSLVSYAMFNYGILVDSDMIINIAETHTGEALALVNQSSLLWWLITGVLPAILIMRVPLQYPGLLKEMLHKIASMLVAMLVIGLIASLYYKDYAAIGRNNSYLKKMIIPTQYLRSAGQYLNKTYLTSVRPHQSLGEDATVATHTERKPRLMVLVVGETARAKNFELNGYQRPTNAFTRDLGMLSFQNVSSCGTATAISVPCMFSRLDKSDYDPSIAKTQDNLLDIIRHAKVAVRWMENDGGCKGVCARIPTLEFASDSNSEHCDGEYCRDEVLLENMQAELAMLEGQDAVLVMHLVGSHGPTYYQRYPSEFRRFVPDCPRSDIQNCSDAEIVNSYDNTIYHDDYILSQIIAKLTLKQTDWETSLLYLSDHGESLGENGMYLHGMPYAFAPEEQTQIPLQLWMSPAFSQSGDYNQACLEQRAQNEQYSHDNLFDSVLGLMQINTELYRPAQDIFASCRNQETIAAKPVRLADPA